jgi:hypothetical protein
MRKSVLWLLQLGCVTGAGAAHAEITVSNLPPNSTLRYPVALIEGRTDAADKTLLVLENRSSRLASRRFTTEVYGGRFKALTQLVAGNNQIELSDGQSKHTLTLNYQPMTTTHVVRVIYLTDSSGGTDYITQRDNDPQNYRARLSTAAKLMQTMTAETMNAQGFGRKTFRLELDPQGEVVVHTVKSPHPKAYYRTFRKSKTESGGYELYARVNEFIEPRFPTAQAKNIVIMGFSDYDTATRTDYAHTALGGGGLGLFGSLNLFSWPSNLQEVQGVFSDATPVDAGRVLDDSAFRSRIWGLAATTIGATLHEMGHTFGLPHSPDSFSIMSRGFDAFNRVFTLREPPRLSKTETLDFQDDEIARFERTSAARLAYSPWFAMDARPQTSSAEPKITIDAKGKIVVEASAGVRFVGINRDEQSRDTIFYPDSAPKRVTFSRSELIQRAGGDDFELVASDINGQQTYANKNQLAQPK